MTTQGFFGRPAQYAAQNSCHRRLVAAGLNWVTHNDVDEFIAPPYTAETAPLKALLRREELRAKVPAALAMPCIFYAPCRPAAARGGLLLDGVDCAGKVQMYRQKLVAHKSALYLWVHYVRIAAPGAGAIRNLPPSEMLLAHVRTGYALGNAQSARAIDSRIPSADEFAAYVDAVVPRLQGLSCPDAAESAAWRVADSPRRPREQAPLFSCDHGPDGVPWGWCYCRDATPDAWADATRATLRQLYDATQLEAIRRHARGSVPATWPG
mmetsp:Transcript_5915/g.18818  ORF Transcript_5915/g.18818 Transcript_5915/m.18818 type:complete len:267 (+) Transcript_5915:1-801(+)